MGNWRRVMIKGRCAAEDVAPLRTMLAIPYGHPFWTCINESTGIGGLPNWSAQTIAALGNLGERDFAVKDVAESLLLVRVAAPSLVLAIHCGADYEKPECIATVTTDGRGPVKILPPAIEVVPEVDDIAFLARLHSAMCDPGNVGSTLLARQDAMLVEDCRP